MVAISLTFLSIAIAAGQVTATAVASRSQVLSGLLKARQGSVISPGDIAAQCQTTCATFVTVFNNCQADESQCLQICSNTVMSSIAQCLSCSISAQGGGTDLTSQAQEALNELEDDCAQAGEPVNSFTVSATGVASATGGSGTSISIPVATGSSQSVFFSSAGSTPSSASAAASLSASAGATSNTALATSVPTLSKNTVTAVSTPASSSTAALNPSASASGVVSGASKTVGVSVLALAGAAVMFAVQL